MKYEAEGMPVQVRRAIVALWISIGVTLLLWMSNFSVGVMNSSEFLFAILILMLFSVLPYKIGKRSNLARQLCIALTLFSQILLILEGNQYLTKLEYVVSMIMLPVDWFIILQLSARPSVVWFRRESQ